MHSRCRTSSGHAIALLLLCCGACMAPLSAVALSGRLSEKPITFPTGTLKSAKGVPIVDPPARIAGYFKLNRTADAHMFYFLFKSRNDAKTDPVVLWMTGGPGCSSELAILYENGPYSINPDMTLTETQYGWDKYHTTIFVDQPINTGFSYSEDDRDRVFDERGVAEDMLDFMRELYEAHPELASRPLYVTGESYAGHYVPAVSHRLWAADKAKDGVYFDLQGIAIGNGLTNPGIQFPAYADFALQNKLISQTLHDSMQFWSPVCTFATRLCNSLGWSWLCSLGQGMCMAITFEPVLVANPNINVYDITKKCEAPLCYDFSLADKFLNLPSTQAALGVGKRQWVGCDMGVYADMSGDWLRNYVGLLPDMLEDGVRVMIYAGELDLICNWLGNLRWVEAMEWSGAPLGAEQDWLVLGKKAGTVRSAGPLSFVKVAGAGHMVPMDQPLNGLAMITAFTRGHALTQTIAPATGATEGGMQKVVAEENVHKVVKAEGPWANQPLDGVGLGGQEEGQGAAGPEDREEALLARLARPAPGVGDWRKADRRARKGSNGQALGLPRVLSLGGGKSGKGEAMAEV